MLVKLEIKEVQKGVAMAPIRATVGKGRHFLVSVLA
jgi:hypothetical protein